MTQPGNGIFVVHGEISTLLTAIRRGSRWGSYDEDKNVLVKQFVELKHTLNHIDDLRSIDAEKFLFPFLEVVRTDETTGAVTSLALAAICKFLSYGLIDPTLSNITTIVENIVDAVTHARFMGTDQSSDGVTLYRVVEVLHTLMRNPEGAFLSNEALCGVMMSCFKICFYEPLNELLRRSAEQSLKDIVQMLFTRLPQFAAESVDDSMMRKLQITSPAVELRNRGNRKKEKQKQQQQQTITTITPDDVELQRNSENSIALEQPIEIQSSQYEPLLETPYHMVDTETIANATVIESGISQEESSVHDDEGTVIIPNSYNDVSGELNEITTQQATELHPVASNADQIIKDDVVNDSPDSVKGQSNEYINSVGVRFTHEATESGVEGTVGALVVKRPHGLSCIHELFRFLTLICNPKDSQNTDLMMHMGLNLLIVAFEIGADVIGQNETLLQLVKDDLCRNIIAQMSSEKLWIFAANLQLSFLLFESLRGHLKFQMEAFLRKLSEVIATDNPKITYEMRELAMEYLLQYCHIPGFMAELYINYDCDLYCVDMYESIVNLVSKYTLSATNSIYSTHLIAMETLVTVIESVEKNCAAAKNNDVNQNVEVVVQLENSNVSIVEQHCIAVHDKDDDHDDIIRATSTTKTIAYLLNSKRNLSGYGLRYDRNTVPDQFTRSHLAEVKRKKRTIAMGTELFNQRPDKGIQCLQENGILNSPLDAVEVAMFLRENPSLDKMMIGEYISKKKNVDSQILLNFVNSFEFKNIRIDQALRLYLETFRLPGEAPLIFLVLEHFAEHWHSQNGRPFANTDAAFSLAYAIIMLNMDQHNSNAKRLNIPMTQEDFQKNLRGLNGGSDFDQEMLTTIFHSIKNEEIVMPAEQTGLIRENYLWKVLLRRGEGSDGVFYYVEDARYDIDLFKAIWGPTLSVLSFMFDKNKESAAPVTLSNFLKCATILAHYNLYEDFDALILTLCKFTTLLQSPQQDSIMAGNGIGSHNSSSTSLSSSNHSEITQAVQFGWNHKAQEALRTVFCLVHEHGDSLRDSWRYIFDLFLQLFRLKLLPKPIMEVEDFSEPNGKIILLLRKPCPPKSEGLFSSLYSYLASDGQREPSFEEQELITMGKDCIKECQLEQVLQETKFLQLESLQEVFRTLLGSIKPPTAAKSETYVYNDDIVVFWLEILVKIVILNRDRMTQLWELVHNQISVLILRAAQYDTDYDYLLNRSVVALFKLAIYLMRNEELCAMVLQSLKVMLLMPQPIILKMSKQISTGMYELLKTSAQNIHSEKDWDIIFTILQCVGAGAAVPTTTTFNSDVLLTTAISGVDKDSEDDSNLATNTDTERPYTITDSDVMTGKLQDNISLDDTGFTGGNCLPSSPIVENWILINKDTDLSTASRSQSPPTGKDTTRSANTLIYPCNLAKPSSFALFKCWDSLSFIVRNVAHITPYNFDSCVRCIRIFVEACCDGGYLEYRLVNVEKANGGQQRKTMMTTTLGSSGYNNRRGVSGQHRKGGRHTSDLLESEALRNQIDDDGDLAQRYETLSVQLLDLMYTLYTRTAKIFRWWAEEGCTPLQCSALWLQGWCPLLQGIARLAMDRRREVRTNAISCLQQRALLMPDLQTLSGEEWALCFRQVLFPLLDELLPQSSAIAHLDTALLEESRVRIATIMSKVFLHHLTPLIALGGGFQDLWMDVLDYVEKFMKVGSDMLFEQMQEILKNMLLVMHSVRLFHNEDGTLCQPLWERTCRRIGEFLPNLMEELFGGIGNGEINASQVPAKTTMGLPPLQSTSPSYPVGNDVLLTNVVNTPVSFQGRSLAAQAVTAATNANDGSFAEASVTPRQGMQPRYNALLTPDLEVAPTSTLLTLRQVLPSVSTVPILVPPQQVFITTNEILPPTGEPHTVTPQKLISIQDDMTVISNHSSFVPPTGQIQNEVTITSGAIGQADMKKALTQSQAPLQTDLLAGSYYAISIEVPETPMVELMHNNNNNGNNNDQPIFHNANSIATDPQYHTTMETNMQQTEPFACREQFNHHNGQHSLIMYHQQETIHPNDGGSGPMRMAP